MSSKRVPPSRRLAVQRFFGCELVRALGWASNGRPQFFNWFLGGTNVFQECDDGGVRGNPILHIGRQPAVELGQLFLRDSESGSQLGELVRLASVVFEVAEEWW